MRLFIAGTVVVPMCITQWQLNGKKVPEREEKQGEFVKLGEWSADSSSARTQSSRNTRTRRPRSFMNWPWENSVALARAGSVAKTRSPHQNSGKQRCSWESRGEYCLAWRL